MRYFFYVRHIIHNAWSQKIDKNIKRVTRREYVNRVQCKSIPQCLPSAICLDDFCFEKCAQNKTTKEATGTYALTNN